MAGLESLLVSSLFMSLFDMPLAGGATAVIMVAVITAAVATMAVAVFAIAMVIVTVTLAMVAQSTGRRPQTRAGPHIATRCPMPPAYCIAGRGQGSAPFLRLSVAASLWRRAGGLFLQRRLAAHEGLWLRPCRAIHTVGMRSAIDVVFLDRQGNVVYTVHSLRPNRAVWCWRAHSVVELPAHYCRKNKYYAPALKRAVHKATV